MNGISEWVYKLYSLGYSPIPIAKHSKVPNGFELQELKFYHYNRPSKEVIDAWLAKDLYENIALLLGEAHGNLLCFDFDNPVAFEELKLSPEELVKEGTWVTETPNEKGRYHIFVENTSDEALTRETSHSVELRSNEHYVLFYPSIHPNGKQYNLLNTHKASLLTRTKQLDAPTLWEKWKVVLDAAFTDEEEVESHIKKKKEFDRSPDCIRNAWELGSPIGERQFTIIGLSNWMRENSFPREMATDVITNWFKTKCNRRGKPIAEVRDAIIAGYDDKYSYGCRYWRLNTSFCPFKEKTDCNWYQPDIKTKHELMAQHNAIEVSSKGVSRICAPNLAKLIIEEHNYNFLTIIDTTSDSEQIYFYEDGYYKPRGKNKIRQLVNYYLDDQSSEFYKREIIGYIRDSKHIERSDLEPDINLLNLKNGIYNLKTGELSEHSSKYYFINQIPINYNSDAKCPKTKNFFKDVLYESHIDVMQEIFGFSLYRDYFLHVAFLFVGGGRNGKGVTVNLLRHLVGKNNYSTKSIHDIGENRFATYELYGRLVNIGAEVSDRELKSTSMFKNLTGNEPAAAEMKHGASFSFMNYAKLVFNANRIPYSHDHSLAFKERWIIIPFPNTFPRGGANTDPEVEKKVTTEAELEGLLLWAIEGLKRLLKRYDFSYEVKDQYKEMINPERSFILNRLEIQYGQFLPLDELYSSYSNWCHKKQYQVVTKEILKEKIQYYKPECIYKRKRIEDDRVHGFESLSFTATKEE